MCRSFANYVQDFQKEKKGDVMQEIIVRSVVNSDLVTTPRQAMALAKQVQMVSQNRSEIVVSFAGITTITAAFANRLS